MKSRTLVVTALVLALVAPMAAQASSARIAGLSVPADLVRDEVGSFTYLSALASQGNLLWVEPGNGGNEGAGAVLQNLWGGRYGTWAVSVRRFAPALGQAMRLDPISFSGRPPMSLSDANATGQSLDLSWARSFGGRTLGLNLQRSFRSRETAAGTTEGDGELGRNITGFGVGLGAPLLGRDTEFGLHWQIRNFKGTRAETPSVARGQGGVSWLVAARQFVKGSSGVTWTPAIKAFSLDFTRDSTGTRRKLIYSGWNAGMAGSWTVGGDDLFVLGAQVGSLRTDQIDPSAQFVTTEDFTPMVFVALESKVNSWLTLRFGARNTLYHRLKLDTTGAAVTPGSTTERRDTFAFDMGASVKLGTLTMDAVLAPGFYDGPVDAVLNDGLGTAPFPRVSVGYAF